MPSCVVKSCRNNTSDHKKHHGITFHRFPSANEVWREDWVNVIKKCRGEVNWIPTKSSVVCSDHFDVNDLYTTDKGRVRVCNHAVPTKLLCGAHDINTEIDEVVDTSFVPALPAEQSSSGSIHLYVSQVSSTTEVLNTSCTPVVQYRSARTPVCSPKIHESQDPLDFNSSLDPAEKYGETEIEEKVSIDQLEIHETETQESDIDTKEHLEGLRQYFSQPSSSFAPADHDAEPPRKKLARQSPHYDHNCPHLEVPKYNTLAMYWSEKLEKLSTNQRIYAEKAINDVLFEAELGNLTKNSVKINENTEACNYRPESSS